MDTDLSFRIIQFFVFILFMAHRAYYNRKYPPQDESTLELMDEEPGSKFANLLAIPAFLSLLVFVFIPRWISWAGRPFPVGLRWFGVFLAILGFGLLQGSHNALGKNWSDQPRIMEGQSLIVSGPYHRVRHPIYTAFLLILGSSLFISANWLVGGLWVLVTALDVRLRIRFEEARMLARFGDEYQVYLERTGAMLPRFWKH